MTFRAENSLMGRCVREIVLGPAAPGPPANRGPRTNAARNPRPKKNNPEEVELVPSASAPARLLGAGAGPRPQQLAE
jgi:hypothetical protein